MYLRWHCRDMCWEATQCNFSSSHVTFGRLWQSCSLDNFCLHTKHEGGKGKEKERTTKRGYTFGDLARFFFFFSSRAQWNIPTCAPANTQSISLCLCQTHTHMYSTVHVMIYSEGGGSAFVQMCASLNACPQKDKNHWPVLHGAHRHWHALHQAEESLFSIRLLISASKHSLSSSIFSHLICQRLKKQRQKSRGGEFAPCALQSLHRWKAEFHLKMFGIVLRWIKLPQTAWVGCDIFGRAAINRIHQKQKF